MGKIGCPRNFSGGTTPLGRPYPGARQRARDEVRDPRMQSGGISNYCVCFWHSTPNHVSRCFRVSHTSVVQRDPGPLSHPSRLGRGREGRSLESAISQSVTAFSPHIWEVGSHIPPVGNRWLGGRRPRVDGRRPPDGMGTSRVEEQRLTDFPTADPRQVPALRPRRG